MTDKPANVSYAEIEAAILAVPYEKTPVTYNDDPLYVALLVRHILEARSDKEWRPIETAPKTPGAQILAHAVGADNRPMIFVAHWMNPQDHVQLDHHGRGPK